MKYFEHRQFLLLFSLLTFITAGCQQSEESIPFFDGLYLKYYEVFRNSDESKDIIWTREIEYRFSKLENGNFHILQIVNTRRGEKLGEKLELVPYPQVGNDLTLDVNGIVIKGGDNFNFPEGRLSYLWLPSDKRKKGAEVIKIIREVEGKRIWNGMEVWPVKGILENTYYYELDTGIFVGSENIKGKLKMRIIDTNHDELKAVLSR